MEDWELGKKTNEPFLFALRKPSIDPERFEPREYFRITKFENGVRIDAVRTQDFVSLTFEALGFKIVGRKYPSLKKRAGERGRLRVILPPQHLAEGVHIGKGSPEEFAKHRLSRPSVLAFEVKDGVEWKPKIRLAQLLDWKKLQLLVHPRAHSLLNDTDDRVAGQLRAAFGDHFKEILERLEYGDAIAAIGATITSPNPGQTALDLSGRVIFSPSERASWVHPPQPQWGQNDVPIWSLELDNNEEANLRAIYSRQLGDGFPSLPSGDEGPSFEFLQTLTPRQQWDIVAQTSVPGLPALRRLEKSDETGAVGSSDAHSPEVPLVGVVRPRDLTIRFLEQIDEIRGFQHKDAGIALATPFEKTMLRMTALGATFEGVWKGSPARVFHALEAEDSAPDGSLPPGFDLERLQINTWLGRDIEVVAVEKGFLFPLGMPASLVTIHERRIFTIDGQRVSMLYRRQYISCSSEARSYPGPYQPFDGREFPATSVTMHTLVTPTLEERISNIDWKEGKARKIKLEPQAIFWPRVTDQAGNNPKEFVFEWSTQDAPRIRGHLLFVKNKEVGREDVMEALVTYYEEELDREDATGSTREYLKHAMLDGASHTYAPAGDKPGSTSFDTVYWKLGARGRYDPGSKDDFFSMDGLMEGADQPPFYPVMRKAEIAIQSLNQMMGTPKGTTEVSYYTGYVQHGIDDQPVADGATSPQIFLNVKKAVMFDPSRRANRSGGIASPDVNIVALSRLTGLVGGKRSARILAKDSLEFDDAAEGRFNPKQFFDGAELLGLFALEDLIDLAGDYALEHAPQMIEEVEDGAREALETVQELAKGLLEALYGKAGGKGLMDDLKKEIDGLTIGAGGIAIKLEDLYPELQQKLQPFLPPDSGEEADVEKALKRLALQADVSVIKDLSHDFKDAVQAMQKVIRDPVPRVFLEQMEELAKRFKNSIDTAAKFLRDTAGEFQTALIGALKDALCASISDPDGYGRILFGSHSIDCDELFARPAQVLERAGRGVLAAGMERIFASAEPFLARGLALQLQLSWEVARIEQAAQDALEEAILSIEHQLEPYVDLVDDIRDPQRQARFKQEITEVIGEYLGVQEPLARLDTKELLEQLYKQLDKVEKELASQIEEKLRELENGIRPLPDFDKQKLLNQLVAGLQESIRRRIANPLITEFEGMLERVRSELQAQAGLRVRAVEQNVVALLETVLASKEMADIARVGTQVEGMCDAAGDAAKSAFGELLGDAAQITRKVVAFRDAAKRLRIPDGEEFDVVRRARGRLVQVAERIIGVDVQLKNARDDLAVRTDSICDAPREWLELVTDIAEHKHRIGAELHQAAQDLGILQQHSSLTAFASNDQEVEEAVRLAGDIQLQLMGITALADPGNLTKLQDAITKIEVAPNLSDFAERVKKALEEAKTLADKIRASINDMGTDAGKLQAVSHRILNEFIKAFEQDVVGSILQTVAFPQSLIDNIERELAKPLSVLATLVTDFYELATDATETFVAPVLEFGESEGGPEPYATLAAIYRFVLGVPNASDFRTSYILPIEQAQIALPAEKELITALGPDSTLEEIQAVAVLFRDPTCTPLPQSALLKLFCHIRTLARFESGETLVARLHDMLRDVEKRLRDLATQFVPAKLTTSYSWGTKLKKFPSSGMFDPGETNAEGNHLTISGRYSFDVLNQDQEVRIKGKLQPCKLWLLGSSLDMIKIHLGTTTFESVNGSKPTFDVDITNVEVGKYLSYIQALQDWLAPKGSGFYIKPAEETGYYGIEAGYRFATGLIQVGTLQFINVSFTAAVVLPFNKPDLGSHKPSGAIFKLALAEVGSPFLVAAPPYGGGGWIVMKAWRDKQKKQIAIRAFDVSIVFGGVAAIRFGPLRANGSILAGIRIEQIGNTHRFTALFHSVGEGSVACFSVCVSLRVTLTQHTESLYGQASFSFSFKVGFAKFRYGVTARYKLKNSKSSNPSALMGKSTNRNVVKIANPGWWSTDVPRKGKDWAAYCEYMDLDILTEAV